MATTAQRKTMGKAMDALVAHRAHVGYLQRRPMETRAIDTLEALLHALVDGIEIDCSEAGELIAHVAGLKPPSGPRFPYYLGETNTQSMYDYLPHYENPADAELGAFVFLGTPGRLTTQHLCVVRHPGADPVVFSHGGNGSYAAHFVALSVEARYHVGRPVFLSIAKL